MVVETNGQDLPDTKNANDLPTMQHEGSAVDASMEHLEKAQKASEEGDNARAIVDYEAAVMLRPNMFHPHMMLGKIMLNGNQTAEALKHFSRAHELQPENLHVLNGIAEVMLRLGDVEAAKGIACEAIAVDDAHAPSICLLANILAGDGEYDDAINLLQCAVEEQPEEWSFWHTIALIQMDRGDSDNALIFFEEALRLNPTSAVVKKGYDEFKKRYPDAGVEPVTAH
ncbi:MAG: tetratricopeptide repeat protein [Pseudomonadota bacterium]